MKISGIDHIVLTVKNLNGTRMFYVDALGMEKRTFGKNRVALHFGSQKINLHEENQPVDKNVKHAKCGSADFCLIVETSIEDVMNELRLKNIEIIAGLSQRTGALGLINSVYLYDPDENLFEIATYC